MSLMTKRNDYIEALNLIIGTYKDNFGLNTPAPLVAHDLFEKVENFVFDFSLDVFDKFNISFPYPILRMSFGTLNVIYEIEDKHLLLEFTEDSDIIKFSGMDGNNNKILGQLNLEFMPLSPLLFLHV